MKIAERARALKVAELIAGEIATGMADGPLAGTLSTRSAVASHVLGLSAAAMRTGLTAPALAEQVTSLLGDDLIDRLGSLISHLEEGRTGVIPMLPGTAVAVGDRGIMTIGALDASGSIRTDAEIVMVSRTQETIVSLSVPGRHRCTPHTLDRYIDAVVERCMATPAALGFTANALASVMRQTSYPDGNSMRLRFPLATPSAGRYDVIVLDALDMEHSHPHELLGGVNDLIGRAEQLAARDIAMHRKVQPLLARLNSVLMEAGLDARVVAGTPRGQAIPILLDGYGSSLMRETTHMFDVNGDQTRWDSLETRLIKDFMPSQATRAKLCPVLRPFGEESVDLTAWQVDAPLIGMIEEMEIDREAFLKALVVKRHGSIMPDMRRRFGMDDRYREMSFTAQDGRISCSVQISPDINWNRNVLVIRNAKIPATMTTALRKQPLESLIAHRLLPPGILILSISTSTGKKGETYTVSMRGMTRPATDETLDLAA